MQPRVGLVVGCVMPSLA